MVPSNLTIQELSNPTEEFVEEAAKLFSILMVADPAAIALTGGNIGLIPTMARAMIKPAALLAGDVYTATDENGVLIGFTIWIRPGEVLFATEEQRAMGFYGFLDKLSDEGKVYYPQVLGKDFPKFIDESVGVPSTEMASYWCYFAMVRADYQGKGVAKALFGLAYEKAKKNGDMMALATTNVRNVAIYEKIGMKVKGHTVMPSPWKEWPAWTFARDTKVE
ncbi:hypothetical protein A0H81_06837 [Grifola frondosa]|uniref:N-acetyltransferase domain-containing protein n=1 Tax=Grifola frondosa TaxID=5627 RepID=A0A1C7M902_GRIFR|nr:hypothetical protein A0H81_06837 [Grifola frondosa]